MIVILHRWRINRVISETEKQEHTSEAWFVPSSWLSVKQPANACHCVRNQFQFDPAVSSSRIPDEVVAVTLLVLKAKQTGLRETHTSQTEHSEHHFN